MSKVQSHVRTRLWRGGRLVEEDFPLERVSDLLDDEEALIWVDLCDPDGKLIAKLAEELELAPQIVEDAVNKLARVRVARESAYTFVTVFATSMEPGDVDQEIDSDEIASSPRLRLAQVSTFLLRRGLVTVRHATGFDMDEVVSRWDENADLLRYGPGALLHGLLDAIVDGHFDTVQDLDDQIETLEDLLFAEGAPDRSLQRRTYLMRKDLVELRRVVLPMREVIGSILRVRRELNSPRDLDVWWEDLYDHVQRVSEWTESLRDMITSVFETNLSLQDARLNVVMKKLTGWAAIIAVPTAVTGWFGQNLPFPGFGDRSGLILSLSVIVATVLILFLLFRRRGWI